MSRCRVWEVMTLCWQDFEYDTRETCYSLGKQASRCTAKRPPRHATFMPPYSHSAMKPVRIPLTCTCILYYVSNKFDVSTSFQLSVNLRHVTDRRTDGRDATYYRPYTRVLRPLNGAATMRTRCWCFALWEDSGVQCMLFYSWTNMERTTFAKNVVLS